jgi:hypothetical protein
MDDSWREEEDARTLARAMVINGDPDRLKKAKAAAKRLCKEREEHKDDQIEENAALKKIAGEYSNIKEARAAAAKEINDEGDQIG